MMFEQAILTEGGGRTKPWSFAASITVQSTLVAAALIFPMLHVAKLETTIPVSIHVFRSLPPEPIRQVTAQNATVTSNLLSPPNRTYKPFQAPSHIPTKVAMGPDLPGAPIFAINDGSGIGGMSGADIPGLISLAGQHALAVPPPPRPAAQPPAPQAPMRVGGGVQAAKLTFGPKPTYPPLAKQARISGTVTLAARISADGHIRDLRAINGHPMLIPAAIEAVRQWVYLPTLLNGEPVEVLTDIQVNFFLQ